jgi:nucleoid-associated protein YgaU
MSTKLAHAAPAVIVTTIAAALSISIATANPAGAEPRQIPVYTSHQILNGYAPHAGWQLAIANPNRIYPGEVIKIPKSSKTYVVKRGDTLSGIAKKYGVSLLALEVANR